MRIDDKNVGTTPPTAHEALQQRRDSARLARTGRSDHGCVTHDKSSCVERHWDVLSCREAAQAQVVMIGHWKYSSQLLGCCEVHGIIEAWVRPNPSMELVSRAINLPQKLDSKPALTTLDNIGGS